MTDFYHAACFAQDLVRHTAAAEALQHIDPAGSQAKHGEAIADLVKTAEALGFSVMAKVEVAA